METSHIHVTPMMVGVVLASCHVMVAFLHVSEPHLEMTCLRLYAQPSVLVFGPYSVAAILFTLLHRTGTHKRTYRIRSKVHSELVLHIIVSTAYTSTIFKKNKN